MIQVLPLAPPVDFVMTSSSFSDYWIFVEDYFLNGSGTMIPFGFMHLEMLTKESNDLLYNQQAFGL